MSLRILACNRVLYYLASRTDRLQSSNSADVESNALEVIRNRVDAGQVRLLIPTSQVVIEHLRVMACDELPAHARYVVQQILKLRSNKLPIDSVVDEEQVLEQINALTWASESLDFDEAALVVYANAWRADAIVTLNPEWFSPQAIPAMDPEEAGFSRVEFSVPAVTPSRFVETHVVRDTDGDNSSIYVYTPQGKVIQLPANSTPIDFAYDIHTQIGRQCIGAVVNGSRVSLATPLKKKDMVEILCKKGSEPQPAWLDFATTTTARKQIKRDLRKAQSNRGWAIIREGIGDPGSYIEQLKEFAARRNHHHLDNLAAEVGQGHISVIELQRFFKIHSSAPIDGSRTPASQSVWQLASCCNPVDGDSIYGIARSRDRPLKVHKQSCPQIRAIAEDRLRVLSWSSEPCSVSLSMICTDQADILRPILNCFVEQSFEPNLKSFRSLKNGKGRAVIEVFISSKQDWEKLKNLLEVIRELPKVQDFEVKSIKLSAR